MFKKLIFTALVIIGLVALCVNSLSYAQGMLSSLQFDSISEIQGVPPVKSICYVKGLKIRVELSMLGQNSVFISDGQKGYLYFEDKKIAMVVPLSQANNQVPVPTSYKDIPGLSSVGQESVNGKLCDVYEYNKDGNQHKIWVAKDIDFPVKAESMTDQGKVTTYIDNVRKNVILADSLFVLPSDAKIVDAGSIMQGMGNFGK